MCANLRPGEHCRVDENGNKACGPTDFQRGAMLESARLMDAKMRGVPGAAARLRAHREKRLAHAAERRGAKASDKARRGPEVVHDGTYGSPAARVSRRVTRARRPTKVITKIDGLPVREWLAKRRADERRAREAEAARAARVAELASKMDVLGSDFPDRLPAGLSVVSGGARQPAPERVTSRPEVDGPIRVDALLRPVE